MTVLKQNVRPNNSMRAVLCFCYCVGVFVLVTLSQKIINLAQSRPFLYPGLALILLHLAALFLVFVWRRVPRVAIASVVLGFIVAALFLTSLGHVRAIKDFVLATVTQIGFLLSLTIYFGRHQYEKLVMNLATAIVVFAVLEAIVAWLLLAGISLTVGSETYRHQLVFWGIRLHGVAGEPTHFGAVMGAGFLSAMFLFSSSSKKVSTIQTATLVTIGISLLMSGTRNAILSTIAGFLIFTFYGKKRVRLSPFSWVLLVATMSCVLVLASSEIALFLLKNTFRIGVPGSESLRLEKYADAFRLLSESSANELLVGRGFTHIVFNPSTMNQYVEIVLGFGLLGITTFFVMVTLAAARLRNLQRVRPQTGAYALALLSFSLVFFLMLAPLFHIFHMATFVFYLSLFMAFSRYRPRNRSLLRTEPGVILEKNLGSG